MQLKLHDHKDFIALFKPKGFRTHKVSENQWGFVEHIESLLGYKLFVVHRLDKETSGLILFAKTAEAARELGQLFETHQVEKEYWFLSDKEHADASWNVLTHIDKIDHAFVNIADRPANSETRFEKIGPVAEGFLYKAYPKTGKPHQIRLHATKSRIPILGDDEHEGSPFFRMCLQAVHLKFSYQGQTYEFSETPEPFFTEKADSTEPSAVARKNQDHLALQSAFIQRQKLFNWDPNECLRISHKDQTELKADLYGDRLWVYDYSDQTDFLINTADLKKDPVFQGYEIIQRKMINRGTGVGGKEKSTLETENSASWTAEENGLKVVLKTDSGFSPGLFLDQRHNRQWVLDNSSKKKVLNLFSYTSLFSVAAAAGKASQVTTVDVSKKFIEWSKENFLLNSIDPKQHEFFVQDTVLFMKGSLKRERKWDLIICDPPTFGRSEDGTWKIERDLPDLGLNLFNCLNKNGILLFTSNLETVTRDELAQLLTKKIKPIKGQKPFKIERLPFNPLDFELTDDLSNAMKGFFLVRLH